MPKKEEKPKEESEEEEEEDEEDDEDDSESESEEETKDDKAKFTPPPRAEEKAEEKEPEKPKEKPKPFSVEFKGHTEFPPMQAPCKIEYCPTCGLPPDFCQYGPSWDKCKPWCMEKYPHYYPELSGASLEDAKKTAEAAQEKTKEKELPGGKKKGAVSPHVYIKKLSRGGRKCVTQVVGLEGFEIKLDAMAKLFKKKFACGAAVVQGDNGQPDCVEIQGDFGEEVIEIVQSEHKDIPYEKFSCSEGGTKKKGKPNGRQ
mmetsp:Transcript_15622/g.43168  ORF Transcript_15622/g.43168 Transcript_15622/m.43168 type:complete len:258 (+) Transcript_15622:66-839(+)